MKVWVDEETVKAVAVFANPTLGEFYDGVFKDQLGEEYKPREVVRVRLADCLWVGFVIARSPSSSQSLREVFFLHEDESNPFLTSGTGVWEEGVGLVSYGVPQPTDNLVGEKHQIFVVREGTWMDEFVSWLPSTSPKEDALLYTMLKPWVGRLSNYRDSSLLAEFLSRVRQAREKGEVITHGFLQSLLHRIMERRFI